MSTDLAHSALVTHQHDRMTIGVGRPGPDSILVQVAGEIDLGGGNELRAHLCELTKSCRHLVIDLHDVDFLCGRGVTALLAAFRQAEAHGGRLDLAEPSRAVQRVLAACSVSERFTIHPTLTAVATALS